MNEPINLSTVSLLVCTWAVSGPINLYTVSLLVCTWAVSEPVTRVQTLACPCRYDLGCLGAAAAVVDDVAVTGCHAAARLACVMPVEEETVCANTD